MGCPHLRGLAANPALPRALVDRLIAACAGGAVAERLSAACAGGAAAEPLFVACADGLAAVLAERADLGSEQVRALAERSEEAAIVLGRRGRLDPNASYQPDVAMAMLGQGHGRPEWAVRFAADPDVRRRVSLAACPGLPAEVTARLAADPDLEVVEELAFFTTDREILAALAAHAHADIRAAVAANPATPPEVLARLVANDPPPGSCLVCVRKPIPFLHHPECPLLDCDLPPGAACDGTHEYVIHSLLVRAVDNPFTPVSAVIHLADHPSMIVRWTLAARSDLLPDVAERLSTDPIPGVRAALADNPAVPESVIRRLAGDSGHDVARRVALNVNVPLDVLAGLRRAGGQLLPRIAVADPEEVAELAGSSDPHLRALVAERRDLPPEIRDRLAADPDAKVLKAIAPHPGLTGEQLRRMVERHGVRVIVKVATNPDAPAGLLIDLARHQPPAQKVFREIARRPDAPAEALEPCLDDPRARPIAAAHPALPVERIVALLGDDDEEVAAAAATNPSLPESEMARLISLDRPEL